MRNGNVLLEELVALVDYKNIGAIVVHKSTRKQNFLLTKEKAVSTETAFSLHFCAPRKNRTPIKSLEVSCSIH